MFDCGVPLSGRSTRMSTAFLGTSLVAPAVLLLPVPMLIMAHQAHRAGLPDFASRAWDADQDRSFVEVYGYLQVLAAAALLVIFHRRRAAAPIYLGWALALSVVVLDDAFSLHERAGTWSARHLPLPDLPGLRLQDAGELLFWAVCGSLVLIVLVASHLMSSGVAQADSRHLGWIVALLMVFAVGMDMFHAALPAITTASVADQLAIDLEAAGEVVAMILFLLYVLHMWRRTAVPRTPFATCSDEGTALL